MSYRKRFLSGANIFLVLCLTAAVLSGCSKPSVTTDAEVNLTKLGGNTLYAQIYSMVSDPKPYVGKTVCLSGYFSVFDEVDKQGRKVGTLYSCYVPDAAGCCSQGIEFLPAEERSYPEGFPEPGKAITVEGIFEVYQLYGLNRCRLVQAEIY